jgi:16S rRNA (cytosine967-C5)-methyltransferase
LIHLRIPDHAAIAETVRVTGALGKPWARGLINAVLRQYQRNHAALDALADADREAATSHPRWLLDALQQSWPTAVNDIVSANNQQAPMVLRVNQRKNTRDAYLLCLRDAGIEALAAPHTGNGVRLARAVNVERLPGFDDGQVSVQDGAAQLAATLLQPRAGDRILDACAAPGGKTAHLLEVSDNAIELLALDHNAQRLPRIQDNLMRLGLEAQIVQGDAAEPSSWWDQRPFDRILLDAPCSATGVIRRHPDIKLLRRADDIGQLAATQAKMLTALWPLLKSEGILLYSTCSVLAEENAGQIKVFLANHADAELIPIQSAWGRDTGYGRQILPGEDEMDGFFYAMVRKTAGPR